MRLQRRTAAAEPITSRLQGPMPMRRRQGSKTHMSAISTTTPKAQSWPVTASLIPCDFHRMAEKPY